MQITLFLDKPNNTIDGAFELFAKSLRYYLRRCILHNINSEVCKTKDKQINDSNICRSFDEKPLYSGFTEYLITFMANHIKCEIEPSGGIIYSFALPTDYNVKNLPLLIKIIEYGTDTITPTMIFTKSFADFKYIAQKRYKERFQK